MQNSVIMNKKQYNAPTMQTSDTLLLDAILVSTSIEVGGTGDPRIKDEDDLTDEDLYRILLGWD